ncbi:hypothetical protein PF005_g10445 [Phytophthora fragariae]|uniref:Uncharacterized protein n=1 Tax=Phytophthora fragariae TaxID=53985 RepID=A0A6A3YSU3_9STRA|nr:hypothetical protein PF003_g15098 [Phytophthora fragariae]KAE9004667.1 hypothetical protein PF011_g12353 [Phytophthora fragariae]KAE9105210.1 hypothetical protein PF007_g13780 [Phytophthora fragariae]KAE9105607.1 hypothetical protein PF010_g12952 [Phytophthora fragariae]KAE9142472.1 hypothetical protein PF006_g12417 [Phytophthora fragariae]
MWNAFEWLGSIKTGAVDKLVFTASKAVWCSGRHGHAASAFRSCDNGRIVAAKFFE